MKSTVASRRRNSAEMYPLVESYLSSDLSREAFCQLHDIPLCVFAYWYGKYRKAHMENEPGPGGFVPLEIQGSSVLAVLELELGNGKRLRFFNYPTLKYLEGILSMDPC